MSTSGEDTPSEHPPGLIYHYTTQSGLLGIINSGEIWATHFRHLNDTEELHHARKLLLKRADVTIRAEVRQPVTQALEGLDDPNFNLFVASFSEDPDSLPQWRAYAAAGPGYALGFRLRDVQLPDHFKILKCIYDEPEQRRKADEILTGIAKELPRDVPDGVKPQPYAHAITAFALIKDALAFKHLAFEHEKEWRIVSKSMMDDPPSYKEIPVPGGILLTPRPNREEVPLDFREGKSGIIPYRRVPLRYTRDCFPLAEVVVGPCPNPKQSCDAVRSLLVSRLGDWTRNGVTVRPSKIPYRNW